MAVDKSYGSGYKNTGMKKPVAPKAASAKLRRKGGNVAAKKYTSITTSKAKMLPGTSDYVAQENAARKQLGVAGLAARNRQLPRAARATARGLVREVTGVDVSRKGIKVDPFGLAMALPLGKVVKAAKALRAVGKIEQAAGLEARVGAKEAGRFFGGTGKKSQGLGLPMDRAVDVGGKARDYSESLFPRLPSGGGVPGAARTFDKYYDALDEGAGRFVSKKRELLKLKRQAGLTDPKNPNSTYPGVSGSTMGQFTKFPKRGR